MTTDRLERALPDLLLDLYLQSDVPYRNDLVGRTARTRQRPAWTFPGRWLPMADITRERVAAPGLPWRTVGVALVLIALLVGAIVVVGSRRTTLPPPFGVAKTGLVAYAADGDIYVADHQSGKTTAIVTGADDDSNPRWSLDGTRIATRERDPSAGAYGLFVVGSDGAGLTQVTPTPMLAIDTYTFSPDGTAILIGGSSRVAVDGINTTDRSIFIAEADGSGLRTIDVGMIVTRPTYRPPSGEEISFVGADYIGAREGIYAVNADGTGLRTIVAPTSTESLDGGYWSPDGARLAYHKWRDDPNLTARVHLVLADGTGDTVLEPDSVWNAVLSWSNDGTRLAMVRGYSGGYEGSRMVAIPVDGSGPGVEMRSQTDPNGECCSAWAWAPDDATILGTPTDTRGRPLPQVLWDPTTGTMTPAPWDAMSPPNWQRLAP